MTLPFAILPNGFKAVFGRLPSAQDPNKKFLRLGDYLDATALPAVQPAVHYNRADYADMENAYGNDTVGDCTCAGWMHFLVVWLSNTGSTLSKPTMALTLALYSRLFGYVAGQPNTDQGGSLLGVLDGVKANGAYPDGSHKILGYVKVDGTNIDHVKLAIQIFGGVYCGFGVPRSIINSMATLTQGFLWGGDGSAPDPVTNSGHCVYFPGYNENEAIVDSWGYIGGFTWAWFTYYFADAQGGEVYVPLSADWLVVATQQSPSGFNMAQLQADLAAE